MDTQGGAADVVRAIAPALLPLYLMLDGVLPSRGDGEFLDDLKDTIASLRSDRFAESNPPQGSGGVQAEKHESVGPMDLDELARGILSHCHEAGEGRKYAGQLMAAVLALTLNLPGRSISNPIVIVVAASLFLVLPYLSAHFMTAGHEVRLFGRRRLYPLLSIGTVVVVVMVALLKAAF